MFTQPKKFTITFLILIAISTALSLPAKAAKQVGAVEQVSGECSIVRDGQKIDAKRTQPIQINDEISTKAKAEITIRFKDDTQLILGESSHASIDAYVYGGADSNLLFNFSTGTFRAITGKLVEANPEGFNMKTPLTLLGIRGSDVYVLVGMVGEEAGALDLGPNHALEIKTAKQTTRITKPGMRAKISFSGVISSPSPIPPGTVTNMKKLGTAPPSTPKSGGKPSVIPHVPTTPNIHIKPPSPSHPPRPRIH